MSRQQSKRVRSTARPEQRRPSHLAPRRAAVVYHDGYAFELAQDLRDQGFEVDEQPLLAASRASQSKHLAVVAARPDGVRPQRLCTLLRELCGHGVPVLATGAALAAVVRLFGGRPRSPSTATARLADITFEPDSMFAGVASPMRLALPAGPTVHRCAVSQELRVVAEARTGEAIGLSHVFRPVHAVHTAVTDNDALRKNVLSNVAQSLAEGHTHFR